MLKIVHNKMGFAGISCQKVQPSLVQGLLKYIQVGLCLDFHSHEKSRALTCRQ